MRRHIKPAEEYFKELPSSFGTFQSINSGWPDPLLELITKHDVRPRHANLVINVKPAGQ